MMASYIHPVTTAASPSQAPPLPPFGNDPPVAPPCWLRLGKKIRNFGVEINRYRGDAAVGLELNGSSYDILLIPRFRHRFEKRGGRPPRRLFKVPGEIAAGLKAKEKGNNRYRYIRDDIFAPFVVKRGIPIGAFEKNVPVNTTDVAFFASGMLTFTLNHGDLVGEKHDRFMLLSSELFLRSPLEAGDKVDVESGTLTGSSGEILMAYDNNDTHIVRMEGGDVEVEGMHLRRHFSVGDHVDVIASSASGWAGRVGFVTKKENKVIVVQSKDTKEEVWPLHSFKSLG